jgi:3-phenylpropionate/trans-cinnamate dioxygenase ferredoxin component
MAFVKAAKLSDIPLGQVRLVEVDDEEVALCNVGGEVFAVANVCTHDGGPLGEGEMVDHQIECPRHGARFDVRTGAVTVLPAVLPIPTYEVRVEGDDILIDIS